MDGICPNLDEPVSLFSKEGPYVEPIASIGKQPLSPGGQSSIQTTLPAYVSIVGPQQFCAYPVTILKESSWNQRSPFFGKLAELHSDNTSFLPLGALVTAEGNSFAPTPFYPPDSWYYIGSQEDLRQFFHVVIRIAEQLEWWRLEDPERFLVPPEPKQPFDATTPLYFPEEAWSEIRPFLEWVQSTLPSLWDQVNGRIIYVPSLGFATANYDATIDRIHCGPAFVENLKTGRYAVAAALLIHELAHQGSNDRGVIDPLLAFTWSAMKLWLYSDQAPEWRMQDPLEGVWYGSLIESTLQEIALPPGGSPFEEPIAYAAMCGKSSWFPESERIAICDSFAQLNTEQILGMIESSSFPKEAYPLARGYLEDGLRQALAGPQEWVWGKIFLDAFDRHVACAQGQTQQCPDWPIASLLDTSSLFAP